MCCGKWSALWTYYVILKRVTAHERKSKSRNLFIFGPMLIGTFLLILGREIPRKSLWHRFWSTLYIYAYFIVDISEDEYLNFVQNIHIVHHRSEQTNINSSLKTKFIRLKDKRCESSSNFTKYAILFSTNFATSTQNQSDQYKFQYKSLIHYLRHRINHFIFYSTC